MSQKPTKIQRLRYAFDNTMAAGPIALTGWLGLASLIVIGIIALIIVLAQIAPAGASPLGFAEAFWESLMRALDAGTLGGDVGWGFRLIMLIVTLWGIFVVSSLIGILSAGVQQKLDELRKGRSIVLEQGHTIILNWSASISDIIQQLCVAHAGVHRYRVVVMANKDKVAMEDELAAKLTLPKNVKVICRSGDPTDLTDLQIVNLQDSDSIIILASDTPDPDSQSIKSVLAITNDPKRRKAPYRIAAEFRSHANAAIAKDLAGAEIQAVQADDLLSRIIVQCCRQAGLSAVYSELLDFEGCEIYTIAMPELHGRRYGDALMSFDQGALIGICDDAGAVTLNPPADYRFTPTIRALVIAEDKSSIRVNAGLNAAQIDAESIRERIHTGFLPERTLILGWNHRVPAIAAELSRYMQKGSSLTIVADIDDLEKRTAQIVLPTRNMSVFFVHADATQNATLHKLNVLSYDHIVVMSYCDHMDLQAADTRTLVTLLHLRGLTKKAQKRLNIVSEMADVRNRALADITKADDFVVSNRLVSQMLAQASENEAAAAIFRDLLDEEGAEIYMRPANEYVTPDQPVNFFTIIESARRRGETAFGYLRKGNATPDPRNLSGVVLNPSKTERIAYSKNDFIIVLAAA